MTIEEALENICEEQIPKEVNGISTRYCIRKYEYNSAFGGKVIEVRILPINISPDNIGVTQRYTDEGLISHDFLNRLDMGYGYLEKDIRELLCQYIRNIIGWTDNRVVKEITYEEWVKSEEGDNDDKP